MKKLFIGSLFALSVFAGAAQAAVHSIKAEVNGMVCAFCAQGIEKKMRAQPQTKDVFVDLKNKLVVVEMRDGQHINHDVFKSLIKDAGYDVGKIEMVTMSAQQFKAAAGSKK